MLRNANSYAGRGFSTKEIHTLIDHDIRSHQAAIAMLKIQRNEAAPVSRLPPEVLCGIFLLVRDAEVERNHTYSYVEFRRWVYLGHVSNHWRNVVFTLPSLWNNPLPLGLHHWIDEILKRSPKMVACLSIVADIDCSLSIRGLKKILRHAGSEIRCLHILNMGSKHQDLLESLQIPTLASQIESLSIHRRHDIAYRPTLERDQFSVPDGILTNAANLRHLKIDYCRIGWGSPTLPHITILSLADVKYINTDSCFKHFMDALGKMINLQNLSLKNSLPIAPKSEFTQKVQPGETSNSRKTFSHLRQLDFADESSQANAFFRSCHFPSIFMACIHIHGSESSETIISPNLPDLSSVFSSIAAAMGPTPDSLFEKFTPETFIVDSVDDSRPSWRTLLMLLTDTLYRERSNEVAYQLKNARLAVAVEYAVLDDNNMSSGQTLRAFFSSGFPLHSVTHVYLLSSLNDIEPITLAETIGMLPVVSFVKAQANLAPSLIDAMNPASGVFGASPIGALYFPSLKCIHLEDFRFSSTYNFNNDYYDPMEALQDCIVRRFNHGSLLQKIILRDCDGVTAGDVDDLRQMPVVEVEWEEDPDWEQDENESLSYGSDSDEDADTDAGHSDDSEDQKSESAMDIGNT
ncbi:hypothetical protein HYPSUDRAFT_62387 [Hypholoma sublateritium FD-334 SS-4]|uniref:Uncharacterized protein n=1 Tax=Hypholoma sublateritium (strain FD-334 SS-4) TaxID=945553 RepID=A0A0D2MVI3_HYPSF|nr:hypothetical protein HYPSUDRAFT_62387 [Hypholoma sublateritium FD-334 SS-4]